MGIVLRIPTADDREAQRELRHQLEMSIMAEEVGIALVRAIKRDPSWQVNDLHPREFERFRAAAQRAIEETVTW